jgi:hypothetical protein
LPRTLVASENRGILHNGARKSIEPVKLLLRAGPVPAHFIAPRRHSTRRCARFVACRLPASRRTRTMRPTYSRAVRMQEPIDESGRPVRRIEPT